MSNHCARHRMILGLGQTSCPECRREDDPILHAAQVAVSTWLQWREDAAGDEAPSVEWIEAMEALQARLREAKP